MEEPAFDRVHWLNQIVDVVVFRLKITNSVEEGILSIQETERAPAEVAIEGK